MTMSQLSPKQRRQIIRESILEYSTQQIAEMCHVHKRTILRDIAEWKREGGFEEFLMDEFFRSYPKIKSEFPDKAFDRLCYLLARTMTQKREVKQEVTEDIHEQIDITIYGETEKAILDKAARILESKGARKLSDIH